MATQSVYNYLKVQNRPYSVNDILSNAKIEYSKASIQKSLDELVEKKKIFEKTYGKQKIYCVMQDSTHDSEELLRIDKELQAHAAEVENQLKDIEQEIRTREATLAQLKSSMTLEEARLEKIETEKRVTSLMQEIDELKKSRSSEDFGTAKRKAEADLKDYSREYSKRRRLCIDILDSILENYPGTKKELYEKIGIEDETIS